MARQALQLPLWALLVSSSLLVVAAYMAYSFFLHPLAGLRGPLIARLGLPSWRTTRALKRDMSWTLYALHKRYGPVVRIGSNEISVADAREAAISYRVQKGLRKSKYYSAFDPDAIRVGLLTERDPHRYGELRRLSSASYVRSAVAELEQFVDPLSEELLDPLRSACAKGTGNKSSDSDSKATVNLGEMVQFYAQDATGEIGFGAGFSCIKNGTDGGIADTSPAMLYVALAIGTQPSLIPVARFMSKFVSNPMDSLIGLVSNIRAKRTEEIESGKSARPDMLTKFIEGPPDAVGHKKPTPEQIEIAAVQVI